MYIISDIIIFLTQIIMTTILTLGYPGLFLLMLLESMIFPVPSELVTPFAGYLASSGKLDFWLIVIASTLGSLVGSLISYYIGKKFGHEFIAKYGKYFLVHEHHYQMTVSWFEKSGGKTIFISRFIPVVRHFISIPAGSAKMDLGKFCIFTLAGAGLWNLALTYAGFVLAENWQMISQYTKIFEILVIIVIVIGVIWFFFIRKKCSHK